MSRRTFVLLLLLSLSAVSLAPAQAQSNVFRVGAHVLAWENAVPDQAGDQYLDLLVYKDTIFRLGPEGPEQTRVSHFDLHMLGPGGATGGVLIAEDAVPMPDDPDWISVSDDLGWAGIDTIVPLLDRNSGEMVDVEIHVYWWGLLPVDDADNVFVMSKRPARIEGTITVHGPRGFTIELPDHYTLIQDMRIFSGIEE